RLLPFLRGRSEVTAGLVAGDRAQGDAQATGSARCFSFGQFLLDPASEQLWCDREPVSLKPKAYAVLRYLLENSQRLVTKAELLESVWGGVHVGDAVIKTQLRDIRIALGDLAENPRFIETAHRRGYRFIATVSRVEPSLLANEPRLAEGTFVGRESELSGLSQAFG